jgi:ubiquinone/menaquinone biosynthesis C-methylase UbiE
MNQPNANLKQKEFWSGIGGESWIKDKKDMDRMLHDFGEQALRQISIKIGDNVLDIGCGTGKTTEIISKRVGETGSVMGVDISKSMIAHAKEVNIKNKTKNTTYKVADIQSDTWSTALFNHAYSRFGVMFFENPKMAFKNIYSVLNSKGTMSFICWQSPQENPWHSLTQKIISAYFDTPPIKDIRAPSPFAFQEKEYIEDILQTASFSKIKIKSFKTEMEWFKGQKVEYAAKAMLERNPIIAEQMSNISLRQVNQVIGKLVDSYNQYYQGSLKFPSATWLVSAEKE